MAFADEDRLTSALAENERLRGRLSEFEADRSKAQKSELAEAQAEVADLRQTLHRTETRYRLIVESAVDYVIIAADLDGIVTTWNEAAGEVMGWSAEQMVGRPLSTIFTPQDVEAGVHDREMRFCLTMGKARDERWHLRADGSRFFASGEMMPLYGDDDEPAGFLKIMRDRTREREERSELEASRERLQLALQASDLVGTWDWDILGDKLFCDARFAHLFGVDPALGDIGAPIAEFLDGIHPDDVERIGAAIGVTLNDTGVFSEEYRTIDGDGVIHHVFAQGRCFRDADDKAVRFPGAIVDRTVERVREHRQTALLKLGDDLARGRDTGSTTVKALNILGETLNLTRAGYASVDPDLVSATIIGEWTAEDTKPLTGEFRLGDFGGTFWNDLRSGILRIDDTQSVTTNPQQADAWASIDVRALINMAVIENGRVRVILYLHSAVPRVWHDEELAFVREVLNRAWAVTERRRAEQALIETETRLRLAQESAEIGTFDFDPQTGSLVWDARCRAIFGLSPDVPVTMDDTFLRGLHPEDRERVKAAVDAVLEPDSDGDFDTEYRVIGIEDGALRHVQASGKTLVEAGRTVRFVGAVRETTKQKLAEQHQQLLTRELQHRVKNTLAMVNALANQTLRRANNVQEGLAAFSSRLMALGQAHDILTQTSWTSAPIDAIVGNSLTTHRPEDPSRITISGPDLRLNARQSLALALGIHELATNASKYGALSTDTGSVSVGWTVTSENGGHRHLSFVWQESGGPAVVAPANKGFGSRLIEQAMAAEFGGEVTMDYETDGLICRIEADITTDPDDPEIEVRL